jgi:large subunit ribosomal protein L21
MSMYAIIKSGGKQFRAVPGQTIKVPSLAAEPGEKITFGDVLVTGGDEGITVVRQW